MDDAGSSVDSDTDTDAGAGEYGYRHVDVRELPDAPNPSRHRKEIDEAVGATAFGCNRYTLDPGEQAPWGYHRHPTHEELFDVLSGALTVDTAGEPRVLEPGEALFVPAGAPTRAHNDSGEPVALLAVGAPKDDDGAVVAEKCPDCGEVTDRRHEPVEREGETVYRLFCTGCGVETGLLTTGPDQGR